MADIRVFALPDRRVVLSMLWVFVVFNYIYADILILIFRPGAYQAMAEGMSAPIAYWTLATIEIACTLFIVWYAWTWRRDTPVPK